LGRFFGSVYIRFMIVRILLFAHYRDAVGNGELVVDLPAGATARDAVATLRARHAGAPIPDKPVVALNMNYASLSDVLNDGDELALLPPVAGG
jgi:molybdopterin converting factor small subunit